MLLNSFILFLSALPPNKFENGGSMGIFIEVSGIELDYEPTLLAT